MSAAAGSQKRVLVICQGSLQTVATLTRIQNEISLLQNFEDIRLHVAWLLNWNYCRDPDARWWAASIRSRWHFPNVVLYSLPLLGNGAIERYASAAVRMVLLVGYILARRIEVVQLHSFCGVQGALLRLRKLLRFRVVLDMQGAHPEEVAFRGATGGALRNLDARERQALRDCDSIICVSRNMVDHLVKKHSVTAEKFRVLPCCVPNATVGADPELRRQARQRLGLDGKFVFVYSGGTAAYQCIPQMCELFAQVSRRWPDSMLMVFSWGDLNLFRRCLDGYGADASRCLFKRLDQNEVHDYLVAGDAGFLLREPRLLNHVSSPTKFAEYLAAGLPVITTAYAGDTAGAVFGYGVGTVVDLPPGTDVDALLAFLVEVQSRREEIARRCLEYVERDLVWESHKLELLGAVGVESSAGLHGGRRL